MSNRRMFLMVCCVMVSSAFGADNTYKGLAAIGAAFAVIGAGIGIGNIFSSAAQAIARQPEAAGEIRSQTFLLAILVEGAAILLGLLSLVL